MWMKRIALVAIVGLVVIQAVPYGRSHDDPPVTGEPEWDSPETLALAERACFDCHSNESEWPWYSNVAPISWLVQHDVDEGRERLNWSEWPGRYEADEAAETVREGEMPPAVYTVIHPEARLSADELSQLAAGLERTFGGEGRREAGGSEEADPD